MTNLSHAITEAKKAGFGTLTPWGEICVEKIYAAAFEAGRMAEREACAKVCDLREAQNEEAALECIEKEELDEVSSLLSAAWQIGLCAESIRARSTK